MTQRTLNAVAKNVTILTEHLRGTGGVQSHVRACIDLLSKSDGNVQVISIDRHRNWPGIRTSTDNGVKYFSVSLSRVPFLWILSPLLLWRTLRKTDVVLVVCGHSHVGFVPALMRLRPIVWFATIWGDELAAQAARGDQHARRLLGHPIFPVLEMLERYVLSRSRVIANSFYTEEQVRHVLPSVDVRTILIPIDDIFFSRRPAETGTTSRERYFLFVGRIDDPRKNFIMALEALHLALKIDSSVFLYVVCPRQDGSIDSTLSSLNIQDRVIFFENASDEELALLYQRAVALVLTSVQEGLGLVVFEAMARGTPCIATQCGGPERIIRENPRVGHLIERNNPAACASKMIEMLHNGDRALVRKECELVARKYFHPEKVAQQLLSEIGD